VSCPGCARDAEHGLIAADAELTIITGVRDLLAVEGRYGGRLYGVRRPIRPRGQALPRLHPAAGIHRIAVETGAMRSSYEYVGLEGIVLAWTPFCGSAPGPAGMRCFNSAAEHVAKVAQCRSAIAPLVTGRSLGLNWLLA
jgi:hypothetical protein